jgi:hypothetical protein
MNTQTKEQTTTIPTMMVIWGAMFMSIGVYNIVAYMIMTYGEYQPTFSKDILEQPLLGSLDIKSLAYLASFAIFWGTFLYFKKSLTKIKQDVQDMHIMDKEERFQKFSQRYLTLMFVALAMFESITIIGIIMFLTALSFKSLLFLSVISAVGFIIVMPNKSKFIEYI